MTDTLDRRTAEERFRAVFSPSAPSPPTSAARNRDADAVAAEVMTIAWRRLADVPLDDPRPWLYATARNLGGRRTSRVTRREGEPASRSAPLRRLEVLELDPALGVALRSLSRLDREALLLVAWEDLTPTQAARSLGINPTAFRVRLLRARRRLRASWPGRRTTTASTRTPISRWRPRMSNRPIMSRLRRAGPVPRPRDGDAADLFARIICGRSEAGRTSAAAPAAPAGCRACVRHAPAGGTAGLDGRRGLALDRRRPGRASVTRRSTSTRRSS